nr:hypothetical protein [uncultured Roseovarius sp.]
MAKKREIFYEPHPVSPERKAELIASGYKIRDAAYAPSGVVQAAKTEEFTPESIDTMKRADVIELLEAHGVEGATGKIGDLRNWLKRVMFV